MYNVGFGDCLLISDGSENLVVDFGSDTPYLLPRVADSIESQCRNIDTSILLTHFHQDHINGVIDTKILEKLNIKNVYLPDIFAMRRINNGLDFLQLEILRDILSSIFIFKKPIKINLYTLLKRIIFTNAKIVFLQRGDTFTLDKRNYQVLWPCFDMLKVKKRTENAIISLLEDLRLIGETKHFNSPDTDNSYWKFDLGTIDLFIDKLLEVYKNIMFGEFNEKLLIELEEYYSNMVNSVEHLKEAKSDIVKKAKERIASIIAQGNRASIVFHDKSENEKSNILMTGDITPSDFKKILNFNTDFVISKEYNTIKAPHHATESHLITTLPKCKSILVSNGEPSRCHKHWGKIAYQYGSLYARNREVKIECVNCRCILIDLIEPQKCDFCVGKSRDYIDIVI